MDVHKCGNCGADTKIVDADSCGKCYEDLARSVDRVVMPDDEAAKWAWKQVKNDCDLHSLTAGEITTHHGFFMQGWHYRASLERQRKNKA